MEVFTKFCLGVFLVLAGLPTILGWASLYRPELTNWPPGTHNGTEHEHHAAFLSTSGGVRSGFNPSLFSDASCGAIQI